MRLVADSGLWSTGAISDPGTTPLLAVLEVSGAVLSWTIDDAPDAAQITFTDTSRAEWLWRVLGEPGHVTLASALDAGDAAEPGSIELAGVSVIPGSLRPLRRLAVGHWLRRWWPASRQDGIAGLDRAVLDVEVALLTAGAQGFFADDTLDSDVAELLAPHAAALIADVAAADPRIVDLARAGAGLAEEFGVDVASGVPLTMPSGRRDDYALAAGVDTGPAGAASIARGVASINWSAVPPAIFDAAEDTVRWSVQATGNTPVAVVRAALIGPDPAAGIPVRLRSQAVGAAGVLDGDGNATLPLVDGPRGPMTETVAWDHDWSATSVIVGAETTESREIRERVRRWARARLDVPPPDAFLAEILASESAY